MAEQLNEDEAIEIERSGVWKWWTNRERLMFQMSQDNLCMPFEVFHKATEVVLGRPVLIDEYVIGHLLNEFVENEADSKIKLKSTIPFANSKHLILKWLSQHPGATQWEVGKACYPASREVCQDYNPDDLQHIRNRNKWASQALSRLKAIGRVIKGMDHKWFVKE
jgi:hypothetical protein